MNELLATWGQGIIDEFEKREGVIEENAVFISALGSLPAHTSRYNSTQLSSRMNKEASNVDYILGPRSDKRISYECELNGSRLLVWFDEYSEVEVSLYTLSHVELRGTDGVSYEVNAAGGYTSFIDREGTLDGLIRGIFSNRLKGIDSGVLVEDDGSGTEMYVSVVPDDFDGDTIRLSRLDGVSADEVRLYLLDFRVGSIDYEVGITSNILDDTLADIEWGMGVNRDDKDRTPSELYSHLLEDPLMSSFLYKVGLI
jgi:hypothetical protein